MQAGIKVHTSKVAHKQFRWLCVSPYLLLSLITAGISLPVAVSLVNENSIQSQFNDSHFAPSKDFSFADLVNSYTSNIILNELFGTASSFTHKSLLANDHNKILAYFSTNHTDYTFYKFQNSRYQSKIDLFFSLNFYKSGSISAFSSDLFSSHPRIHFFCISHWISHLFSIDSN